MSKVKSEAELLKACQVGSREAFGTIVEQYQSLICAITYSATGNFARSEELAQETFIQAWKKLGHLRNVEKFRVWLCTIARNLVRKSIKNQKQDIIAHAKPLEEVGEIGTSELGPSEAAISKEQETIIWGALQEIPEQYREPMVLFYREQRSVSRIATQLGLSEDAAKQRLSRGRKLLKREVATVVEEVLGRTVPGKVFTMAVLAALPAVAPKVASAAIAGTTAKSTLAKVGFLSKLSGSILGPLVGTLGGLQGTWMSIKHTKSLRERKFMIKTSVIMWLLFFLLICLQLILALVGTIPKWGYWLSFVVFFALLIPSIIWVNRRQLQIQKADGTYVKPEYRPIKMSKGNIYGAFGGIVFGSVVWLMAISIVTRDWWIGVVVILVAISIFVISIKKCLSRQNRFWDIAIWDVLILSALHFVVLNLRWGIWTAHFEESKRYLMYTRISPWVMNLVIGIVFGGILLLFVVRSKKQSRLEEESKRDITK